MGAGSQIWGWDGAAWQKVLVNAAGNLEIMPAAAAVFPSHCYGWDGANWQELLVESAASPNLRTRLYDGVNPVVSVGTAADIADANRGLFTQAGVRGWDGTFWKSVNVEDGAGDAVANARASLDVFSRLYGYNGATWDRLRVESAALHNLRVRLYDGANGIDSELLSSVNIADTQRGLIVNSINRLWDGANNIFYRQISAITVGDNSSGAASPIVALTGYNGATWDRLRVMTPGDAFVTPTFALQVASFLMGYNGTTWDMVRMESAALHNLRVRLYDGANGIDSDLLSNATIADTQRGLIVNSIPRIFDIGAGVFYRQLSAASLGDNTTGAAIPLAALYGYNGNRFDRFRMQDATYHNLRVTLYHLGSAAIIYPIAIDAVSSSRAALYTCSFLYGYNGTTWDRLRTYGTGILKVGRAEVGLLDVRMTAVGQVGAVGAKKLYWMTMNPTAANSVIELTDAVAGGAAVKWDMTHGVNSSHHMNLDPPLEFTNGIYLETFTNMTSVIFGYL